MSYSQMLQLASLYVGQAQMRSSAELCITQAIARRRAYDDVNAKRWLLNSLRYSIGILHPDYQRAEAACR